MLFKTVFRDISAGCILVFFLRRNTEFPVASGLSYTCSPPDWHSRRKMLPEDTQQAEIPIELLNWGIMMFKNMYVEKKLLKIRYIR